VWQDQQKDKNSIRISKTPDQIKLDEQRTAAVEAALKLCREEEQAFRQGHRRLVRA
jgi:hypothetical protein